MTLAAATTLLQIALSLLMIVEVNPQLTPEVREIYLTTAKEAVTQVTQAVAAQASAQIGQGAAKNDTNAVGLPVGPGLLVVTPTLGTAPLQVSFSAPESLTGISYGDGVSCSTSAYNNCRDSNRELKPHVYQKAGSYLVSATHSSPGGLVGEVIVTVLAPGAITCPVLVHDLEPGDNDAGTRGEVTKLQTFLVAHGYTDKQFVTGVFDDNATLTNLMRFQMNHGIEGIGVVGPKTRALITEMCSEED